ncbi:hypothetical protein H4S01_007001, partial [Coemansia sp. RSA 2610]
MSLSAFESAIMAPSRLGRLLLFPCLAVAVMETSGTCTSVEAAELINRWNSEANVEC